MLQIGLTTSLGTIDISGLLMIVLLLAGFGASVYWTLQQGLARTWRVLLTNTLVLGVVAAVFYAAAPVWASWLLHKTLYIHAAHIVALFIAVGIGAYAWTLWEDEQGPLAVMYGVLAVVIGFGGMVFITTENHARTAAIYQFGARDDLVHAEPEAIRWTPLEVGFNDMVDSFTSAEYTVELEYADSVPLGDGFGYVTPIVPDGTIMTYTKMNDGFMVYDDRPNVPADVRVRRVKQPYVVGEEMLLFDSLDRQLYYTDRWAIYPDKYELALDPAQPDRFTIVVPKVKFDYQFPIYFIPYWAGVNLIHSDGWIEELTVEEAKADQRLAGQMIYPIKLFRHVVDCQIYDEGYLSGWFRRPGKIKIPRLPGYNQMPYLTKGVDGRWYFVVVAEPSGGSGALFRIYYGDAHDGTRTRYAWSDGSHGVLGPEVAIERVRQLPGYRWVQSGTKGAETGDFQVLESVYVTRQSDPHNVYWKYTITTGRMRGVIETVVVDGARKSLHRFTNREQFVAWVRGEAVPTAIDAVESGGVAERATRLLEQGEKFLSELKILLRELGAAEEKEEAGSE